MTGTRQPLTIIYGGSVAQADAWCRENGVKPRARHTVILASRYAARGLHITDDDTIVYLGGHVHEDLARDIAIARGSLTRERRGQAIRP